MNLRPFYGGVFWGSRPNAAGFLRHLLGAIGSQASVSATAFPFDIEHGRLFMPSFACINMFGEAP